MPGGTLVDRHWVVVLRDGGMAIDWGGGQFQDVISGAFLHIEEPRISHTITDAELDYLKYSGYIDAYDDQQVGFLGLPERISRSID